MQDEVDQAMWTFALRSFALPKPHSTLGFNNVTHFSNIFLLIPTMFWQGRGFFLEGSPDHCLFSPFPTKFRNLGLVPLSLPCSGRELPKVRPWENIVGFLLFFFQLAIFVFWKIPLESRLYFCSILQILVQDPGDSHSTYHIWKEFWWVLVIYITCYLWLNCDV